jgi:hypothetical protein
MVDALVYGIVWLQVEVQVDAWLMHGSYLMVQVYSCISHSDSVTVVPSFYFYFRVAGRGQGQVVVATFRRTLGVVASFWL